MNLMRVTAVATAITACAALVAGCTTEGYQRADQTGSSLNHFRDEIVALKQAVETNLSDLDKVGEAASTNPRPAFDGFSKSLARLEAAYHKVQSRTEVIKSKGKAYFDAWQKELETVQNPEIRELAQSRKEKISQTFGKLPPLLEQLKESFDPFYSNLNDLRKVLGQDLTVAGIDASRGLMKNSSGQGTKVGKSLDEIVAELDSIVAAITPAKVGPPPGSASGKTDSRPKSGTK